MKKTTSRILLSALTVLALLSLSGCAQEKEENTKQSDPQAREAILQCCETIFGSTEETGTYHIRVTDERDGGRVDEYDCPRGVNKWGEAFSRPTGYRRKRPLPRRRKRTGKPARIGPCREFSYGDKTISVVPRSGDRSPAEGENWHYEFPCGDTLRLTDGTETVYVKNDSGWLAERLSACMQEAG